MLTPTSSGTGAEAIRALLDRLRAAPERALLLDFDGTIAPFRVDWLETRPYPVAAEILQRMLEAGHTRIVMVTGRPVDQLLGRLDLAPTPEIWGTHGWERRLPGGRRADTLPDADAVRTLDAAWCAAEAADLLGRGERKSASIAIHWRGLAPERIAWLERHAREVWASVIAGGRCEIRGFDGGLELRLRGRSKGDAVSTVLAEMSPDVAAAFLGDDETDEDGFIAIRPRGLGILVSERPRPTRAQARLRPPDELIGFLAEWHRCAGGAR